jgi:hypothetical protein
MDRLAQCLGRVDHTPCAYRLCTVLCHNLGVSSSSIRIVPPLLALLGRLIMALDNVLAEIGLLTLHPCFKSRLEGGVEDG